MGKPHRTQTQGCRAYAPPGGSHGPSERGGSPSEGAGQDHELQRRHGAEGAKGSGG
ncbi:hypothetical protein ACT4VS_18220 (plasmid) [Acinetobacter baumannii]